MSEVNGRLWTLEGAREFLEEKNKMKLTAEKARKISYEAKINMIYDRIMKAANRGENEVYVEILHQGIIKNLEENEYILKELNQKNKYKITW